MADLLLKNGRVIDPSRNLDEKLDLLLQDGKIARLGVNLNVPGTEVLDLSQMIVAPGFVDMHVHLREPGNEEAETIATGLAAAAAGGFTAVACMPNTKPVNDNAGITAFLRKKALEAASVQVYPIAAVTKNEAGVELTDMDALKEAGAVAFSDDGKPVADSALMRRALENGKRLGVPIIDHCEDPALARGAAMHEGAVSLRMGIRGMPAAAEEIMVSRNVHLARLTGGAVHMAHMSTAGAMEEIRRAKRAGLPVTAEVTPHHFTLTDEDVSTYGTLAKMNPPLRTREDVQAVLEAIADGTVDCIASDHAPHHAEKKQVEFHSAAFGILGLETSVSLGLDRLVHSGRISLARFIELYSLSGARILGIRRGIAEKEPANLTVFHPNLTVRVNASAFLSLSRNTPFHGWTLRGCPTVTLVRGNIVWKR